MRKSSLFFAFLLFTFYLSQAQNFGGNPSSIKWQQINTDTVRVIFPRGYDAKAQRIANIVHVLQRDHSQNIGNQLRKVNIVLQNQTLLSNGYVALGPYRSEFYTTPPQNAFALDAVNWTDNLTLHEFRHIQQYNNFNKGLSKAATFLFGENGQAVANAMSVPDWFFEGDAVFNETKFTQQGRGTLPLFLSSYQSLFVASRKYDYMKMRNGSLRDYVPNHYDLGYLLVAYGRKKYGDDLWRKVTDDAARFKPLFYPFQGAMKKQTGIPFGQFVNDAMGYYQQQWASIKTDTAAWITPVAKHNVVNYQYPYTDENGSLIVVKNSTTQVPAFYRIHPDRTEERIATKSIAADPYFSYNNGRIVYASYQPDPRWRNRDYTAIKLLNVQTGEETNVVSRSKYVSPDISHDGRSVIAVSIPPSGGSKIVVMNTEGAVTDSLPSNDLIFSYPKFAAGDKHYYVASRNSIGEMSLLKYTMNDTRPAEVLLRASNRIIGFLQVQGDTLLFTTTFQGRDELWGIIDGKERKGPFRMASYVTGLYQGTLQAGKIVASAFTADGYRLAAFDPIWERTELKDELTGLYINDVYRKEDRALLVNLPQQQYAVNSYPKATRLLNFHSFRPYYERPEYSLTVYGNNVLNTLLSEVAYTYNENEGSHKIGYNAVFGSSYLQPLVGISQTWNRSATLNKDTTLHWNELVGYAGLQLPLDLSGGKRYRFLTLSSTYNINNVKWTGIAEKLLQNRDFQYLQTRISYTGQSQKALRQIYPGFAESLLLQYRNSTTNYTAHQFLSTASLYLPGLGSTHSLVLTGGFHSRDTMNQYVFSNNFPFSRGYTAIDFPQMWKLGVNYHIPLAYPDWGFGNLVYFLRIRANLFFDYTEGKSLRTGITYPFKTVGTELFFDTRWWNQQPVTFGVRYSRLLDNEFRGATQPNVWEFILPVNLFN